MVGDCLNAKFVRGEGGGWLGISAISTYLYIRDPYISVLQLQLIKYIQYYSLYITYIYTLDVQTLQIFTIYNIYNINITSGIRNQERDVWRAQTAIAQIQILEYFYKQTVYISSVPYLEIFFSFFSVLYFFLLKNFIFKSYLFSCSCFSFIFPSSFFFLPFPFLLQTNIEFFLNPKLC